MLEAIKLRIQQGDPIIHDVRNATLPKRYRGLPSIESLACRPECRQCADNCPTGAISLNPLSIDMGKCVFCPKCESVCPEKKIHFMPDYHIGTSRRQDLIVTQDTKFVSPEKAEKQIVDYFGKSLKLRQISAGGCNGCEMELNAMSNVNFDIGRYGIDFVASPRHADGIVITGPLTQNMAHATNICFEAVPNPKIVILCGACAISGGVFQESTETMRKFLDEHKIDLFIPGCPPHPLAFINGVLDWLDRK
jgi:Ni,Fe-hydrogenase III small subunit/NAD-dependent dihydropyrimidine dehydrogenase PreA subunit